MLKSQRELALLLSNLSMLPMEFKLKFGCDDAMIATICATSVMTVRRWNLSTENRQAPSKNAKRLLGLSNLLLDNESTIQLLLNP